MTSQWRHKWRHVKNTKITKNRQNHGFSLFFKKKLHFLAMMCVKVCLQMFLLQINQINKIKHSGSVSWKTKKRQKTRFVCNFNGKSVFRCTQRAITQRRVITLDPIFVKMVLNRAQGLKEKSQEPYQDLPSPKEFSHYFWFQKCCWLVMLVVGLIDIQHMQAVIKGFFFPKIATILVIWKSSDRETRVKICLQHLSEGVSHSIEEKSLSSVSELSHLSEGVSHSIEEKSLSSVSELQMPRNIQKWFSWRCVHDIHIAALS